ncbi:hypothetical protein QTP88_018075 [Uroleucon formosanum]
MYECIVSSLSSLLINTGNLSCLSFNVYENIRHFIYHSPILYYRVFRVMRAFTTSAGTISLRWVGGLMAADSWATVVSQHPPNALLRWWSRSEVHPSPSIVFFTNVKPINDLYLKIKIRCITKEYTLVFNIEFVQVIFMNSIVHANIEYGFFSSIVCLLR